MRAESRLNRGRSGIEDKVVALSGLAATGSEEIQEEGRGGKKPPATIKRDFSTFHRGRRN